MFLECCCQNVDDVRKAEAGGALRIELCEQLPLDGLTPSDENVLMTLATVSIPVNVLVRCRAGNFVYTDEEIDTMARDIERICRLIAKASDGSERRVNAVVVGALTAEGDVDVRAMRRLLEAAGTRPVTFHRAFDVCRDPLQPMTIYPHWGYAAYSPRVTRRQRGRDVNFWRNWCGKASLLVPLFWLGVASVRII